MGLEAGYLPAVVEVPVWIHLQLLHLLHLIQHLMHIELGHEELQTPVSVSLTVKHEKHIYYCGLRFYTYMHVMHVQSHW